MATLPTSASESLLSDMANEGQLFEMRRIAAEIAARNIEGLKLYEPSPEQLRFHMSMAKERVIRGSNMVGKTLAASVEVARAVTGQDPLNRYPKENGICYCVGFDGKHIADPMWKKLSKAGSFLMIRDLGTMKWRSFRPWLLSDKLREAEAKPAPPLIPPRMIDFISWEIKKTNQPNMVKLKNGWEIHFYSGNAKPAQGSQISLCWVDEELASEEWYAELAARLLFKNGYFFWSATPLAGTERLYHLHERAEREAEINRQPRTVEEFVLLQDSNPHISDEQKTAWMEKLTDEDRDARVNGDFSRISRVFPEYSSKYHEIPFRLIPLDWSRYVAVDPGRQVCAAMFLAVPPPEHPEGKHVFLYDEIYIRDCDAMKFGLAMKSKCQGQDFQEFFIDPHEAPKHDTGSGRTVMDQYVEQLKVNGVRSAANGFGFTLGDMNVESGIESIRTWLRRIGLPPNVSGKYDPQAKLYDRYSPLRVLSDKCPNFIWEIKRYRFKRIKGVVTDKPDQKNNHAIDALRYLAQAELEYAPRTHRGRNDPPVYAAFKQFMKSQNQGGGGLILGPGNSFQK